MDNTMSENKHTPWSGDSHTSDSTSRTLAELQIEGFEEERCRLAKMWFPHFMDADVEAMYVVSEVNAVMKNRMWLVYWSVTIPLVAVDIERFLLLYQLEYECVSAYVALCIVWALQFIISQAILLFRCIRCIAQDTAFALWGPVLSSSLVWTNAWRMGMVVAGDGKYFGDLASKNDELFLLCMVAGVALTTQFLPLRGVQAMVNLHIAPIYAVSCLGGISPSGFSFSNMILLVAVSCNSWRGQWKHGIHSRVDWIRLMTSEKQAIVLKGELDKMRRKSAKRGRSATMERYYEILRDAIADGDEQAISCAKESLKRYLSPEAVVESVRAEEKRQSEEGGICLSYLLSDEFLQFAQDRTGKDNPTFYDLKESCFMVANAVGKDIRCPRDGELGCSFLDALPRRNRRKCTHFLSWIWAYHIRMYRECLSEWAEEEEQGAVFFYCCFFVNNQHRILVQGVANGSDNLETIFAERLSRIGKMVAMLDDWKQPAYLTRIWTIFEQACAVDHQIPVTMLLPCDARDALVAKLETGKAGIQEVQRELLQIDAENAHAYKLQDEVKVKEYIKRKMGFRCVNKAVGRSMMKWIGEVVRHHFEEVCEHVDEDCQKVSL